MKDNIQQTETAVRRLGLGMVIVKAGSESEIESAILGPSIGEGGELASMCLTTRAGLKSAAQRAD